MKSSFKKLITADIPVLIDFHAEWCGPCKMLAPVLKQVKDVLGDQVKIIKIDIDQNQALANRFQVRGVPTMMLFKNGNMVWRQSGLVPKEQILNAIQAA